jgi:hypothetical protein
MRRGSGQYGRPESDRHLPIEQRQLHPIKGGWAIFAGMGMVHGRTEAETREKAREADEQLARIDARIEQERREGLI